MATATSTGPITIPQVNNSFYVSEGAFDTIQEAVDYAQEFNNGVGQVIIEEGYQGTEQISSIVNGAPGIVLFDQRNGNVQLYAWSLNNTYTPADFVQLGKFSIGPSPAPKISTDGSRISIDALGTDGIYLNFESGNFVEFGNGAGGVVATLNSDGDLSIERNFFASGSARVTGDTTTGALFSTANPVNTVPVGSASLSFDPNGTGGNGSANLRVTASAGMPSPALNIQAQPSDGVTPFHTYIRCEVSSTTGLPRTLIPNDVDITGNLTAVDATLSGDLSAQTATILGELSATDLALTGSISAADAEFGTCEVAGSPVRTFANTADGGMVYPPAGVPQSTGSAWGTSIDPATLPRLNVANTFTATQTVQGAVKATGSASPLDVTKSAAIIGTGSSNTHPNLTLINSTAVPNNRAWAFSVFPDSGQGEVLSFALEDDTGNANYWMAAWRNGTNGTKVEIVPPLTLDGALTAAAASFSGALTAASATVSGTLRGGGFTAYTNAVPIAFPNDCTLRNASRDVTFNAPGGTIFFNVDSGTTGVVFGDGNQHVMGSVDGAGNALFVGTLNVHGAVTCGSTVALAADPTQPLQAATKQYVDNSGPKVIQAADEPTAISLSNANPNNIYFWV